MNPSPALNIVDFSDAVSLAHSPTAPVHPSQDAARIDTLHFTQLSSPIMVNHSHNAIFLISISTNWQPSNVSPPPSSTRIPPASLKAFVHEISCRSHTSPGFINPTSTLFRHCSASRSYSAYLQPPWESLRAHRDRSPTAFLVSSSLLW